MPLLTIGELSDRSGVAPSALRFYETEGLLHSERSSGGQRRYHRDAFVGSASSASPRRSACRSPRSRRRSRRYPTPARRRRRTGPGCRRRGSRASTIRSGCSSDCATDCPRASGAAACRSRSAASSTPTTSRAAAVPVPATSSMTSRPDRPTGAWQAPAAQTRSRIARKPAVPTDGPCDALATFGRLDVWFPSISCRLERAGCGGRRGRRGRRPQQLRTPASGAGTSARGRASTRRRP